MRPTRIPSALSGEQLRPLITNYKRLAIDAGILCLIVLVTYAVSCIGGFVFNDHYIDNFLAIGLSEESFWSNLIIRAISQPLSQPWIIASFAFDLQNFGFDPSWYHVVNIILHFASCFYFYLFVYTLARYFWQDDGQRKPVHEVALFACALFACHPLASESVAHIIGRQATLTACNFFLTLNFFVWAFLTLSVRSMLRNYVLSFCFLVQAILCGVQSLAIPSIMLLIAFLVKPLDVSLKDWLKHKWGEIIVALLLFIALPFLALPGFSADFSNGLVSPMPDRQVYLASQFQAFLTYYLRSFLLPIGLSIFPPFSKAVSFVDPLAIIGLIIFGISTYAIYKFRSQPLAAIGLGVAIFSYLPWMFFVQNEIAADWRFYLSSAGLSLFVASLISPWLFEWRTNDKTKAALLVSLVGLIAINIVRNIDYRTDVTLFKSAIRVNQNDTLANGMLALSLVRERKEEQGVKLAEKIIASDTHCQPAYYALGKAYIPTKKGAPTAKSRYEKAKTYLEQALSLAKSQRLSRLVLFECERDLSSVLTELGEYKKAKEFTEQALSINPNSAILNLNMGKIFNAQGEHVKALVHLNKVYQRDNTNPEIVEPLIEAELGIASPRLINAAYNTAKMGIVVCPTHRLRVLLGQASLATGNLNESMQWSEGALRERPNDPSAIYLRSFVLKAAGQRATAKLLEERALALDPNLPQKMKIVCLNKDKTVVIPFEELYPLAGK